MSIPSSHSRRTSSKRKDLVGSYPDRELPPTNGNINDRVLPISKHVHGGAPHLHNKTNKIDPNLQNKTNKIDPNLQNKTNKIDPNLQNKIDPNLQNKTNKIDPNLQNKTDLNLQNKTNKIDPNRTGWHYPPRLEPSSVNREFGVETGTQKENRTRNYDIYVPSSDRIKSTCTDMNRMTTKLSVSQKFTTPTICRPFDDLQINDIPWGSEPPPPNFLRESHQELVPRKFGFPIGRKITKWTLRKLTGKCELERLAQTYEPQAVETCLLQSRSICKSPIPRILLTQVLQEIDVGNHPEDSFNPLAAYRKIFTGKARKEQLEEGLLLWGNFTICHLLAKDGKMHKRALESLVKLKHEASQKGSVYVDGLRGISFSSKKVIKSLEDVIDAVLSKKQIVEIEEFYTGMHRNLSAIQSKTRATLVIETLAQTPYDSSNDTHERLLSLLWSHLQPDKRLSARFSRDWQTLGFQGCDPATDFRGCGALALVNLAYFVTHYNKSATRLYREATYHPTLAYSFAVTGINITAWLRSWMFERTGAILRTGRPSALNVRKMERDQSFDLFGRERGLSYLPSRDHTPHESSCVSISRTPTRAYENKTPRSQPTIYPRNSGPRAPIALSGTVVDAVDDNQLPDLWTFISPQAGSNLAATSGFKAAINTLCGKAAPLPAKSMSRFFHQVNSPSEAIRIFNRLYVYTFLCFHKYWVVNNPPSVMEFPRISALFRQQFVFPNNKTSLQLASLSFDLV
eukprot:GHVP01010519.1.p1 GENE.GHVP01010519.1~~GHVP01010519.1.p1  ORF type:complete len:740 (+),score=120.43 GHVP01010519.1:1562-3781(+)